MKKDSVKSLCYIAMMAVLICICSWISVPFVIPFTLQTFAVFFSLLLLGGKKGTASICLYLLMGIIGLPVFSGFGGGIGHLFGPTGGYIIGFVFTGAAYILLERLTENSKIIQWVAFVIGLFLCYLIGTLWFTAVYSLQGNSVGFLRAFSMCVLPYLIPDCVKIVLAIYIHSLIKSKV